MRRQTYTIVARSNIISKENDLSSNIYHLEQESSPGKVLEEVTTEVASHNDSLLFSGGLGVLCIFVATIAYAPALCPLVYLGFAALCLPYRVASFASRKWAFFLVDFCYFANLACCAFLVLRPEDRRLEASVYALCEGPLAAALIAWQCAWLLGSPDHAISVLIHLLPGLALFCHRYLAHSRAPMQLLLDTARALIGSTSTPQTVSSASSLTASGLGGVAMALASRLSAADAVIRGRVPCPVSSTIIPGTCATGALDGSLAMTGHGNNNGSVCAVVHAQGAATTLSAGGAVCYLAPSLTPSPSPAPVWLWLGAAPLGFYLGWQLLYFLVVQVVCRGFILAGGYETSYRALARRAQRANSPLNRLVRSGSVARRLFMYGLLQLLFTLVSQALAVATYYSFAAAAVWQLVKFCVPLYLGAVHQCQRLPARQLQTAAERLAAAGLLTAQEPPQKTRGSLPVTTGTSRRTQQGRVSVRPEQQRRV